MGSSFSSPWYRPQWAFEASLELNDGDVSEKEAWEIAMAWAPLLKTADVTVGLAIDHDSSAPTIVDKYAWARFQMPYVVERGSPR
jgi:hypothetical protein